jgi:hypothetical protein
MGCAYDRGAGGHFVTSLPVERVMHQTVKWIVRVGVVVSIAALAGAAMAQNTQPNPSRAPNQSAGGPVDARGPLPAPVGHRQPKQSDLPPAAVNRENQVGSGFRDLDDKLRICKGC